MVASTALLVTEATKITLGQSLKVLTRHQIKAILEIKGHLQMTGERLTKYQAVPLSDPDFSIRTWNTLNPASLMPTNLPAEHSCEEVTQTYASCPDLPDQPLPSPEEEDCFTDGQRKAGYAVVSLEKNNRLISLPPGISAQ